MRQKIAIFSIVAFSFAAAAEPNPASVKFEPRGHGSQLTDARGMSLYTFVRDSEPGKSNCNGACAEQWPPLEAKAGDQAAADWAPISRQDGTRQWSYRGQPLYTFSRDVSPGDTYGDGINEQWFIALKPIDTPAGVTVRKTLLGHVLADRKGMSVYVSSDARPCDDECALTYPPLAAPWVAVSQGDWSVVARSDGSKQWAYRGKPLHRHAADVKPSETSAHGRKGWSAIVLEPPPPRPAWVVVIGGDAGPILGDMNKKTLYSQVPARPNRARPVTRESTQAGSTRQSVELVGQLMGDVPQSESEIRCGIECPDSVWRPVIAVAGDKPVGNWSLVDRPDGRKHWAYKGNLLYTNIRDTMPGALNGIRSGAGRSMQTLTPSGEQMPGTGA
jgi:predicted lipoprotein with Yx(FWY)xxD motif